MRRVILPSNARICRASSAKSSSIEALASASSSSRRWFSCIVRSTVSWRSRVTRAASWRCAALAGSTATMPLAAAYQAIAAASPGSPASPLAGAGIRSVFSKSPIASAKRRTARGLASAAGRPSAQSKPKARRSYPPVASRTTMPTRCSRQKARSARTPSTVLANRAVRPARCTQASSQALDTSTPQMISVTCLVHAIVHRATVRSGVTGRQVVPRLPRGCDLRAGGRRLPRRVPGGRREPCTTAITTNRRHRPDTRVRVGAGFRREARKPV